VEASASNVWALSARRLFRYRFILWNNGDGSNIPGSQMEPSSSLSIIQIGCGVGFRMQRGARLRVVDICGQQSGDLVAFCDGDSSEALSNGRTFDYLSRLYLRTGDTLYSTRSRPMFKIIADSVSRHDFLYGACTTEMYEIQYGIRNHSNCSDNLMQALRSTGMHVALLPTPLNVFMNVEVHGDGTLSIHPPRSRAGDSIELSAEMDLVVALTACPASLCNGGNAKPLGYEIIDP
jgi:uncharacterized protein